MNIMVYAGASDMGFTIWGELPQFNVKPVKAAVVPPRAIETEKMLMEVGHNVSALNTTRMELGGLKPLFKGFDAEKITPANLERVGKTLFAYGFIDNMTADLMARAALEFGSDGKPLKPDEEIDALQFFARELDSMDTKALRGDKYATMLKPDYVRTVHVMRCLQDFVSTGDTFDVVERKRREKEGELKKAEPLKPVR
jgi:hypothetical protein